ncbi:Succinyl-CoA ligase [ADP-forming] beta chain [Thioalkalivibrio nitratireducens DSM 14787]|uniref:Succinate--CoA ligase [ADP-forming] subunit beta n=1 Tax=Thioalkalivibrio nitratireducens (strain DSM 14787 / UNIQEM 213 / ALEN2) TaxID=1255043 RepID=L0E0G7_THIND|nr:ADP-forming succinate--CoA ligase subunit beta [Thioalkalivibrio nitratireducens]AGA34131.1 Succinyl-CoA ligase [ADP-forming] beta chain [Thioalkalivibrio nitratireducens DSM 14787]
MNLHEFQAKALFRSAGIPVPPGELITGVDDTAGAWARLGADTVWVKAQVHSGGRGKAGGVVRAADPAEAEAAVARLLGSRLVTGAGGPEGLPIDQVLMEPAAAIEREFYFGMLVDRSRASVVMVISAEGGMDIEELARERPVAVVTLPIHPVTGVMPFHGRRAARVLGLRGDPARAAARLVADAYRLFQSSDAQLLEINPLVLTSDDRLLALDGKLVIDDSATYRQREIFGLRDARQRHEAEERAHEHDLNYIRLDGTIGCMVNGAGLAMATMDLIQHHGGQPANFLDVGGGTTVERVAAAFKLILSDTSVRAVLVNIFGGIVRCDLIAEGIIAAVREVHVQVPVVVRLEGTNAEAGREALAASGLDIVAAADLDQAARAAVEAAA